MTLQGACKCVGENVGWGIEWVCWYANVDCIRNLCVYKMWCFTDSLLKEVPSGKFGRGALFSASTVAGFRP